MKIIITIFALTALTLASDIDPQRVLKNGNDQFTARMFSEVVKKNPDKSIIMSAFSVMPPLAQLMLASIGESHDELLKTIDFPNDNVTKAVFSDFIKKVRSIKGVELKLANKVYIANGNELNDQFAVVSRDVFNSEVQNLNFGKNEEAANIINTWVEDHTNKRIKNLVDPSSLDSSTQCVLVNAIYFKGSWKDKFDKELTQDRPFHVNKDKTIQVPTMYKRGDFAYGESSELDAKLIELPYVGEESSLLVVLPNKIDGLHALEEKLKKDLSVLERAQQNMYTNEVDVYLPKFKCETTTNLKEVLQAMNVKKLFEPGQARLDNLLKNGGDLYVSEAVQKAFIEVNEEGAEAAAANEFGITYLSAFISEPKIFNADHPYYYFLKGRDNIIYFTGIFSS